MSTQSEHLISSPLLASSGSATAAGATPMEEYRFEAIGASSQPDSSSSSSSWPDTRRRHVREQAAASVRTAFVYKRRYRLLCLVALLLAATAGTFIALYLLADKRLHDSQSDSDAASQWSYELVEQTFLNALPINAATLIRTDLKNLASRTHIAGTNNNTEAATYVYSQFVDALSADLVQRVTYDVLLSYPVNRSLAMIAPSTVVVFNLTERAYAADPTSSQSGVPSFLAYSGSGELVRRPVLYVNYCRREDFVTLQTVVGRNISGCVALCRYGEIFRGDKVSNSAAAGAVGVLIYSDPADDGYKRGAVYPEGPWRPKTGVQRGSIWDGQGDPTTPGWPSTEGAYRLSIEETIEDEPTLGRPLPTVPALPLSWGDAQHILLALNQSANASETLPDGWQGGLPFNYQIGTPIVPHAVLVNMTVHMNLTMRTITNVIAEIPGKIEPDRVVIIGNHRDAWTFGGVDPLSGTLSLLQTVRGVGALLKDGWRPRRSLMLCSWDAEEFALIGSTEFGEANEARFLHEAVAYLNLDTAVRGSERLHIGGVPSLTQLVVNVTSAQQAPPRAIQGGFNTLYDMWLADISDDADVASSSSDVLLTVHPLREIVNSRPRSRACGERASCMPQTLLTTKGDATTATAAATNDDDAAPILDPSDVGTGSDYGVFVHRLGVPALDFSFHNVSDSYDGVYHSNYDSIYWTETFGDPDLTFHEAMARLWGLIALHLVDDEVLPIRFTEYGVRAQHEFSVLLSRYNLTSGAYPSLAPYVDQLRSTIDKFSATCMTLDATIAQLASDDTWRASPLQVRRLNDALMLLERSFLLYQGLPGREWYRHTLWTPNAFNDYEGGGYPFVGNMLDESDVEGAQKALSVVVNGFVQAMRVMERASSLSRS